MSDLVRDTQFFDCIGIPRWLCHQERSGNGSCKVLGYIWIGDVLVQVGLTRFQNHTQADLSSFRSEYCHHLMSLTLTTNRKLQHPTPIL